MKFAISLLRERLRRFAPLSPKNMPPACFLNGASARTLRSVSGIFGDVHAAAKNEFDFIPRCGAELRSAQRAFGVRALRVCEATRDFLPQ